MAEMLPDLLAAFDAKKQGVISQLANVLAGPKDALAQMLGQQSDSVNARNAQAVQALQSGDMQGVLNSADQGIAPAPSTTIPAMAQVTGRLGAAGQEAIQAARSQLAHYQLPVFDRVLAATQDPAAALETTRKLTNLMGGKPAATVDLTQSMLNAGIKP